MIHSLIRKKYILIGQKYTDTSFSASVCFKKNLFLKQKMYAKRAFIRALYKVSELTPNCTKLRFALKEVALNEVPLCAGFWISYETYYIEKAILSENSQN